MSGTKRRHSKYRNKEYCRHLVMRGENGWMVCQKCGFMRIPYAWENAGQTYIKEDPDEPAPRLEGGGTGF